MYQEKRSLSHLAEPTYVNSHYEGNQPSSTGDESKQTTVLLAKKQVEVWKNNCSPNLLPDNFYYLVSKTWVDKWLKQSEVNSYLTKIEKIDNGDLLDHNNSLKPDLKPQINFFLVTRDFWLELIRWFDGGPEIKRPCYKNETMEVDLYNRSMVALSVFMGLANRVILFCRYFTIEAIYTQVKIELKLDFSCEISLVYIDSEKNSHPFRPHEKLDAYLPDIERLVVILIRDGKAGLKFNRLRMIDSNSSSDPGMRGLTNLGNTCFMNSALQCLSASVPLTDFLLSGEYEEELNLENPLGHGGAFIREYANLLRQLWGAESTIGDTHVLKKTIEKSCHRFAGYYQHDAQEFLAFLLDGLHEDLNRVKKKPYVENVEGADLPDEEAANRAWSGYKLRNDSIVVDWFQGLFKSKLICSVCGKVSITFDPFMYMTLPLVKDIMKILTFTVVPLNGTLIRCKVKCQLTTLRDAVVRLLGIVGLRDPDPSRYKIYENNRGFYRSISLEASIGLLSEYEEYYVYEFESDYSRLPPLCEVENYSNGTADLGSTADASAFGRRGAVDYRGDVGDGDGDEIMLNGDDEEYVNCEEDEEEEEEVVSKLPLFSPVQRAPRDGGAMPFDDTVENGYSKSGGSVSHHIMYFRTDSGLWGIPLLLSIRSRFTYRQLYNFVKDILNRCLSVSYPELPVEWEPGDSEEDEERHLSQKKGYYRHFRDYRRGNDDDGSDTGNGIGGKLAFNFNQKRIKSYGGAFSIVVGSMSGEFKRLLKNDKRPLNIDRSESLIVYWDSAQSKSLKEVNFKDFIVNHSSIRDTGSAPKRLDLEDCIKLFTEPEYLTGTNIWYCSSCKEHRRAIKTLQPWSLPPILCIHLKRFNGVTRKLDTEVYYPLDDLDLKKYVLNSQQQQSQSQENDRGIYPLYELFAVSNHFGTLAGGHYTAYVRHRSDNQWREYDDSSVRLVSPERVQSSAAYLLFYRRKDAVWPPFDSAIIKQPINKQENKNYFLSNTSSSFSALSQNFCENSSNGADGSETGFLNKEDEYSRIFKSFENKNDGTDGTKELRLTSE